jgi:hypothetical protein
MASVSPGLMYLRLLINFDGLRVLSFGAPDAKERYKPVSIPKKTSATAEKTKAAANGKSP